MSHPHVKAKLIAAALVNGCQEHWEKASAWQEGPLADLFCVRAAYKSNPDIGDTRGRSITLSFTAYHCAEKVSLELRFLVSGTGPGVTDVVRRVTHQRIPGSARKNSEEGSWVICLT